MLQNEGVETELQTVADSDRPLVDGLVVQERSIATPEITNLDIIAIDGELGMPSRDRFGTQNESAIRTSADEERPPSKTKDGLIADVD
ncbi:hypothetical protein AYO47_02435 [Planctomyces sp. SCGC AG-212-M04]|nr:hypothetical protein AYO47_02435 [Planctomyces sp. SCGC AG-212-M04]